MWDFLIFLLPLQSGFDRKAPDTYWRDARVAEEARLESVCTPKGYREFESRSLRNPLRGNAAQRVSAGLFWYAADGELAHRTTNTETARMTVRSWAAFLRRVARTPREGTEIAAASRPAGISLKNHSLKSDEKPLSILPNHLLRRHTQRLVELLPKRPDKRLLQELIHSNPLAPPLLKGASTNIPAV